MNNNIFKYHWYSLLKNNKKKEKYYDRIVVDYDYILNFFDKKAKLDLTDIEKLAERPFRFYTSELFYFTDCYGNNYTLKKYLTLPNSYQFKLVIQHATNFRDRKVDQEFDQNLPIILTNSTLTKKLLSKYAPQAELIPISYPFLYASDYFSKEKFLKEKQRLGKNLLFFPIHSDCNLSISFNLQYLLEKLEKIKEDYHFDSITICCYWLDILNNSIHQICKNFSHNYNIVCAGHLMDINFLPRLKTIINLSDLVVSNFPGSYLFYSMALNKPFYLMEDDSIQNTIKPGNEHVKEFQDWKEKLFSLPEVKEFFEVLNEPRLTASDKQIELRDRYCGLDSFKNPQELREIIDYSEELYKNGNYKKYALPTEIYW
ncbi:hypothetical protein [Thomasclavelia cocleata]|uniref:hypothetical protein n=1 Tax=Thomasclavelia cocleata TaxID=69824 RepID=UPI0025A2F885|nr:hypothetical protein [Thomasclavelia cocleata]